MSQTVTLGIVSALRRSNIGAAGYEDFIQTDAAINPGNSGGALINSRGELVGINTAIYSQSGGYQGIGFAVPSNLARKVMDDLVRYGEVRRGYLGYFETIPLTADIAAELGVSRTRGVVVNRMDRTSAAYGAGMRPGDVILTFESATIEDGGQLQRLIADAKVGTTVRMRVERGARQVDLVGPGDAGRAAPRRQLLTSRRPRACTTIMSSPVAFSLFDGQPEWSEMALVVAVTFLLASIASSFTARLVRLALTKIYGKAAEGAPALVSRPVLVTRLVTFLLVFAVTTIPSLDGIGEHLDVGLDSRTAFRWALASGLRIVIIITLAWLVIRMVTTSSARLERELARSTSGMDDRLKRAQTLGGLIQNVTTALVCGVALMMILRELNVDILPMLTGAGIAGVALGFGAQWLVRDLISGFFLILEDQVRVGDGVVINGQGGSVEAINLRTVVLRDVEGAVHIFPAGGITTLANKTRDFAYALVDLAVDFQTDSDRVVQVLRDTAAKLQAGSGLRRRHPRAARSARHRGVPRRPGHDPVPPEDRPPTAGRNRPRAPPARAVCARRGRRRPAAGRPAHPPDPQELRRRRN